MSFSTRRIFKSAITSHNLIRELIQQMMLSEMLASGGQRVWLVSPWISNVVILDNRAAGFTSLNPDWGEREIRLVEILVYLISRGVSLGVATSYDKHNDPLISLLEDGAEEIGAAAKLTIVQKKKLHTKGILVSRGLLTGSMNLTFRGLEINDEHVIYDTTPQSIAQARLAFESYLDQEG
ncbi:phosphatidylserine/phosphatidylglycerophosphate/cardiolipin synthase family protein [Rhizobium leguminosarum]|uniref:phospholipase D-like domain-containing protein DpdK n=1 Tax=Rhizobium leguminosarum TaxID=384 RepID=UPI0013BB8C1A|nr:phospholipase D-like domain-containing protein DpdK [Rhizobium leguminosarum]NEI59442.1 phosphatidylserine/phosphatidylglycerophosphate/cardiolipin synthase family protein [Rhizobium leguminosarum]NEI88282.1 phosphatidylserine/phosphatidylglycerophosphate/cardiolipin synthase family protein [Rhizobium leguminosarum]